MCAGNNVNSLNALGTSSPWHPSILRGGLLDVRKSAIRRIEKYTHGRRRIVAEESAKSTFDEIVELVAKHTGASVPKRQIEELTVRAAQHFDEFYRSRQCPPDPYTRCAPRFQLVIVPSRLLLTIASSDESTIEARSASLASLSDCAPPLRVNRSMVSPLRSCAAPRPTDRAQRIDHADRLVERVVSVVARTELYSPRAKLVVRLRRRPRATGSRTGRRPRSVAARACLRSSRRTRATAPAPGPCPCRSACW